MTLSVYSARFIILTCIFIFIYDPAFGCDTKWLRLTYMNSCSTRKRSIDDSREPEKGYFGGGKLFMMALLDRGFSSEETEMPPWTNGHRENWDEIVVNTKESTTAANFHSYAFSGMNNEDTKHILDDLLDQNNESDVHRRDISNLLGKCCHKPPIYSCSAKDFADACK